MAEKRAVYELQPRVGWRMIGNEIVAFNCNNQRIAIWNESGSLLWEFVAKKCKRGALITGLMEAYRISRSRAVRDVNIFIRELQAGGFLTADTTYCAHLNEDERLSSGEDVLLAVEMRAIENLIPFAATFEVTYACNERCIHCYMDCSKPTLSTEDIERILHELAIEGCLFVTFTGGEVFTRPNFIELVEYAASQHFVVDILSNGTLITPKICERLAKLPVRRVQVSLYGACAETHDAVTRINGSFQASIKAIELLLAADIKVEIAFTLMRVNFAERYDVKAIAERFNCVISINPIVTARNSGAMDTHGFRLNDEEMASFLGDSELSDLYAGRKPFADHQLYFSLPDIMVAPPCYSGFNSCAITPGGKVLPCNQLLFEVGDLAMTSFGEIWHNSQQLGLLRGLTLRSLAQCSKCCHLSQCARCPGLALLEGGDLLGSSPENCRITKLTLNASRERRNE